VVDRHVARQMAQQSLVEGKPLAWFERLYASAEADGVPVPWADLDVNPLLASWAVPTARGGSRALVVGCGYGDDAEWLAARGWDVTAFDISATAVAHCRQRFPDSRVNYVAADLLDPPAAWLSDPFALVVEIYTLQVLPPDSDERAAALRIVGRLAGGSLLVIARLREPDEEAGTMPWPLTRRELASLTGAGLVEQSTEVLLDDEDPPVRRIRSVFARPDHT
jgi:SAM-dependent methyltransferase